MAQQFEVRTGPELARVVAELKRAGAGAIVKQLRTELRAAAAPIVPAVRASIAAIPSNNPNPHLRKEMQRATKLSFVTTGKDAGMVIRVDGRKMPDGEGSLPAYMEGTKKPWRHPVFGNRDNWVVQDAHPYFYKIVKSFGVAARTAMDATMKTISEEVA